MTVLKGAGSSARKDRSAPVATVGSIPLPGPGEMIGSFRLGEAIGVGGMGAVFRALDTRLDRQVALKLLPPDQAVDDEVVLRFYQEGRSAAQLDHENIARVFSIGQDGVFHYIAFEYIEGVTLRRRVESDGPLSPREAVDLALQIAQALVHASRRGVVHRDIKPSNIILTPQGRAKLVDMGLARRFERGGDHGLTQSGMTLGTFDYISPEQARDPRDVDVRSDLYSLGCTLFHTLTGRPPFPGGTVLQKLLQHQEEPPADVRTLNPDVPAELAAIIAKLMAKERERRYQGPEHLVRDLLALAGPLGLDRVVPERGAWMVPENPTWWERHLVWLLPALGFLVVISGLSWWGREFSRPPASPRRPSGDASGRGTSQLSVAGAPGTPGRPISAGAAAGAGLSTPAVTPSRPLPVSSAEDLDEILAGAPSGSVIILSDDGPYRLGGRGPTGRSQGPAVGVDLTLKADLGVHPVLMSAGEAGAVEGGGPSLLRFAGGHVSVEGLEFDLDAPDSGGPASAIRCEDAELVVRGCSFRWKGQPGRAARDQAALLVRASRPRVRGVSRPPAVVVEACHFDGGPVAVRAQGPADITLADCTLGPSRPSIWFDGTRSDLAVPGELRLSHASLLAGEGPVFRLDGGPVRVRVDDSVVAPAGRAPAALVQVEDPAGLDWRGRDNLYGAISPYLTTQGGVPEAADVEDYAGWERGATGDREAGSRAVDGPVWRTDDPLRTLAEERDNPTRVFLLHPRLASGSGVGARRGPFGASLEDVRLARGSPASRTVASASPPAGLTDPAGPRPKAQPTVPRSPETGRERPAREESEPADDRSAPMETSDPSSLPTMPPMSPSGPPPAEMEPGDDTGPPPPPQPTSGPMRREPAVGTPSTREAEPSPSDEDVIRGPEQLRAMLRHLGVRGGILRIGAGVEMDLPPLEIAARDIEIRAEPGALRPRLRLHLAATSGTTATGWAAMLDLRSGSLRLQGLDLVVHGPEALASERVAAIAMAVGTRLTLDECTVTVAVRRSTATAVLIHPTMTPAVPTGPEAWVTIREGLIRSGGDAVTVAGGARLALEVRGTMIATEGSLLHSLGGAPAATGAPPLGLRMDRVNARVKGGLVHLEAAPESPALAPVDARADRSILSTAAGDHPLFLLEGRDPLERLGDKIRWEGHHNAYHRIKTYRRDEIVQAGGLPLNYGRDDWTRAFRPTDESPMLSDLRFRRPVDAQAPAWTLDRDDLRLAGGSAGPFGPDADKVPDPPPEAGL